MKFQLLFKKIITENFNNYLIENISQEEAFQFISSLKNLNNSYADIQNLNKFFINRENGWNKDYIFKIIKNPINKILAIAVVIQIGPKILYINQITSFQKGYGRILLNNILQNNSYDLIYLNSYSETNQNKLNNWYRSFSDLIEIPNKNIFYKNFNLNKQQLEKFLKTLHSYE